jgi:hypothetical protein
MTIQFRRNEKKTIYRVLLKFEKILTIYIIYQQVLWCTKSV